MFQFQLIIHVMPLVFQLMQFSISYATNFLVVFSCMRSNFFTLSIIIFKFEKVNWSPITYVKPSGSCCNNCFWNGDWQVKCTKNCSLWLATGIFLRFDLVFRSYLNPFIIFYGCWLLVYFLATFLVWSIFIHSYSLRHDLLVLWCNLPLYFALYAISLAH